MSDTPGRGYLPPTVPAPGSHRRQWPPSFNFYQSQWQPGKQFIMAPSSPPQSESMDLSSRPDMNGGEVNGTGVSVIATNPLVAEEKPGKLPSESARVFESKPPEQFLAPKAIPVIPVEEKVPTHPMEGKTPPDLPAGSRTPPTEEAVGLSLAAPLPPGPSLAAPLPPGTSLAAPLSAGPSLAVPLPACPSLTDPLPTNPLPQPDVPAEDPIPPSESAATPVEEKTVDPDHVESLLENMFQGEAKPSVIVTNCSRPVLTEDKVVEILQDKDTSFTEIKSEEDEQKEDTEIQEVKEIKEEEEEPVREETKDPIMEVESELEKMFAGIEEEKPAPLGTDVLNQTKTKTKRTSKPRQRKSTDSVDTKKKKLKKERPTQKKTKREKDTSNDSSTIIRNFKGPFVHIEGTKDNPSYIGVVNSSGKEEEEKDMVKIGVKRKHHTVTEGRVKGSNLYSSTLSSKYNSHNIDPTWICVFCKKRAHCEGGLGGEPAGDLFGPYILNIPKLPDMDRGVPSDKDVMSEQKKKGGGKASSLRAIGAIDAFISNFSKKSKKSGLSEDMSGEREVWVHEKCVIWASGVYLAGAHIVGLAEAVASAAFTKCNVCGVNGACIGCVKRNCSGRVHFGCGFGSGWLLDDNEFLSLCHTHSAKKPKKVA